jgi:NAD(P)-dependent dehydrogenase (short-subunit alcohol dehydrogenase family)
MREQPLNQRIVLVIGGSSGIGLETARHARRQGADVIITARDPDRVVSAGIDVGSSVAAFDATDFDRLQRFVSELPDPIDHVLLTGPASYKTTLEDFNLGRAQHDVDAHLMLPLHLAQHARHLVRPGGTLTFIGCTDDQGGSRGVALTAALTVAMSALAKCLARELAPIRVNQITACFVNTPLSAALPPDRDAAARRERLGRSVPTGQGVEPGDIAALAIHIMTNPAITGATFDVDGGQHAIARLARC